MKAVEAVTGEVRDPRDADGALRADASLVDPGVIPHPQDFYRAVRDAPGIHYDAKLDMYLVSRHEDIQTVVKDPVLFSVKRGYEELYAKGFLDEFKQILIRDGGGFFPDHIMADPPEHGRIRKLLEGAFTARRVRMIEPAIRAVAADMIDAMLARDGFDGVEDFAIPLTVRTVCRKLGLDEMDAGRIHRWSLAMTAQIGSMQSRDDMLANAAQMAELQRYIIGFLEARRADRGEDMISDLVHGHIDDPAHPTLAFEELVSLSRLLMLGGIDNTAAGVASLLLLLATRPEVMARLHEAVDDELKMNRFVEEYFRIQSPARGTTRLAMRAVELAGTTLPEGAHMLMLWGAANLDAAEFPDPDSFDSARPNLLRQVAFGNGIHRCVGIALARLELKIAAQELGRRVKAVRLAVPEGEVAYLATVATNVVTRLPIALVARD